MKKYLVVATEDELRLPWAQANDHREVIVCGIAGANVIRNLKDLPPDSDILNVGYCGSLCYPVGSVVWVETSRLWHPSVDFEEPVFHLPSSSGVTCLTAGDFVTDGSLLPPNAVVDMELAYIMAFGFQSLRAVKYVSDNLNLQQYEKTLGHETQQG